MTPLLAIAIQQAPGLIVDLVEVWRKTNPGVTLEEYLTAIGDNLSFEERRRRAAAALGMPYTPLVLPPSNPSSDPKLTAQDVLDAIMIGAAPTWFPPEAAAVVLRWANKMATP
jgi:hypothetical protein